MPNFLSCGMSNRFFYTGFLMLSALRMPFIWGTFKTTTGQMTIKLVRIIEMAQAISGILSQRSADGEPYEPIGKVSSIGAILGIIAAIIGLVLSGGYSLIPMPSIGALVLKNSSHYFASAIFLALLSIGLLIQAIGSKNLRNYLGSGLPNIILITAIIGLISAFFVIDGGLNWHKPHEVIAYVVHSMSLGAFFVVTWQITSVIYIDSDKSIIGFIAGMFNALFVPILAIGQAMVFIDASNVMIVYIAYLILLIGQIFTFLYWRAPINNLREYVRSTRFAKIGFSITGLIVFFLGLFAIFSSTAIKEGFAIWFPWDTMVSTTEFLTQPAIIYGLLALMIYWVLLAPRLGAREQKETQLGEDIVKGGAKWFMIFLGFFGIFATSQAGTMVENVIGGWGGFMVLCPAAIIFIMGALYAEQTDIVTGLPMVLAAIFLMVHPFVLSQFILIPWTLIIISQIFLLFEVIKRGLGQFSQPQLTVFVTVISSFVFVLFILGLFGSGPAAIWPVNRWFPIALFSDIPIDVQIPTILALPIAALLIRNVALVGFAKGRGQVGAGVLGGMSILFAFLIPMIGDPSASITHKALTAASIMLALYAVSFVLVLSINMNLAHDVENTGNPYEGMLVRMSSIVGVILGAIIATIVMIVFSGFPSPTDIGMMLMLLVTLIVSLEILNFISWAIIGVRLGMLRSGWSFKRVQFTER